MTEKPMTEQGSYRRVGKTDEALYGPRGVLVCGLSVDEQQQLLGLLTVISFPDLPVIFAGEPEADRTLSELLALPHLHGKGSDSKLRRAVVMSGFTEKELHLFMGAYKSTALGRPLWATLTPHSENWSLLQLLTELSAETRISQ